LLSCVGYATLHNTATTSKTVELLFHLY